MQYIVVHVNGVEHVRPVGNIRVRVAKFGHTYLSYEPGVGYNHSIKNEIVDEDIMTINEMLKHPKAAGKRVSE